MIKMKSLHSFHGREGKIRRGREFDVEFDGRAKELEDHGLAYRVVVEKKEPPPLNKMEPPPSNKAANEGPLGSVGGETGAESAPSSSDQDHLPRWRRSKKPKDALDL